MADAQERLGPAEIREARARVARTARITPLVPSEALAKRLGHPVSFKCENLQIGGAFKIRGASNFLAGLDPAVAARGVITYSSGNHAIALAIAARRAGVPGVVVMPENAPAVKIETAQQNGAEVHFRGTTSIERKALAEEIQKQRDLTMVPPFDHPAIIAGQASCGVEILEQMPDVGVVLVPVGGGGLLSGIALIQDRDWYFEGAMVLALAQLPDGNWPGELLPENAIETNAMAILFLKQSTVPVLTGR